MKYILLLLAPICVALHTREPPPPPVARDSPEATEHWLNVRLNHFDASNTDTFPMRFFYNNEFGGPNVVILVGGEWTISPGWTQTGLHHELARSVGAGVFYTEHRYYGQTRPGNDTAVDQLRYLTVDQALADLAQFIQHVKSPDFDHGQYQNGSVVLVGCSYAGSMATWMRLAYPHLVDAAFSDSGPLHAQEDFPEYLEIITEALRAQGGESCVASIEESMRALQELLSTPNGPTTVSTMFNTCTTITTTPLDLATFYWFGITESFAYLVQYATPGDIPAACANLTNTTVGAVQRLADWIRVQPWTQPCIETRYSEMVLEHTNTSYDSPQSVMRLWTYQTCVEYGWYQTTNSSRQPFLQTVPLEYFHQMCKDFFSNFFDESFLRSGIERTNRLFGGLTHMPDHVVSVAGSHDPWSPMGPDATHATPKSPVYVVPFVSHCRAYRPTNDSETAELAVVKLEVLSYLHEMVTGHPLYPSSADRIAAGAILLIAVLTALY